MSRTDVTSGPRPWTRADLVATTVGVAIQVVVWAAVAFAAGLVWSRFDGAPIVQRFGHALAIGGAICLLGAGTIASKVTTLDYMQWGISGRNASLFGDDIGSADLGLLTPLGESMVTAVLLFTLAVVVG